MQNPINIEKIAELGNVSTATAYRWIKHPRFPKPAKVPRTANYGPTNIKCWEQQDVVNWMASENKIPAPNSRTANLEARLKEIEEDSNYISVMVGVVTALAVALAIFRYYA